jgi:hypothetical protein
MDSSDQKAEHRQFSHEACDCRDHEWETIGIIIEPDPGHFLRGERWFSEHCCSHRMRRAKKVAIKRCKKCGIMRKNIRENNHALCDFCGRYYYVNRGPMSSSE